MDAVTWIARLPVSSWPNKMITRTCRFVVIVGFRLFFILWYMSNFVREDFVLLDYVLWDFLLDFSFSATQIICQSV